MTFTEICADFWDNRLPQGMKSQGTPKTFEALGKALKIASYEEICAGLVRYIEHKEDWRAFCMASVFLNQQRWTAEYPEPNPCADMGIDERREFSHKQIAEAKAAGTYPREVK